MHMMRCRTREALLLTVEAGEELTEAITSALAEHGVGHAWIEAQGTLREVAVQDPGGERTFATTSRIVALHGHATAGGNGRGALRLSATVARSSLRGPELLAGSVTRAVAEEVRLLVTTLEPTVAKSRRDDGADEDAAESRRDDDEATEDTIDDDAPAPRAGSRRDDPKPKAAASSPWAALADASAEAQAPPPRAVVRGATAPVRKAPPPSPALPPPAAPTPPRRKSIDQEIYPEPGDLIDHFAFGRCAVLRSDGDELLVQHPGSGRTRTIRLSALHANEPVDEDGKRLFRLTQRRHG